MIILTFSIEFLPLNPYIYFRLSFNCVRIISVYCYSSEILYEFSFQVMALFFIVHYSVIMPENGKDDKGDISGTEG